MYLQFQSMAELPWEGALLESNFRLESKAQGQHLHTTGRVKLTIPWKRTRPWNKLLCNGPIFVILVFRELITASQMYHEKGSLTAPAVFTTKNAFSPLFLHSPPPLFSSPGAFPFIVLGKSVLANNIMEGSRLTIPTFWKFSVSTVFLLIHIWVKRFRTRPRTVKHHIFRW